MLERDSITAALDVLIEQIAGGTGTSAFVFGEPGLGKTALLDWARRSAEAVAHVGWARGNAMESSVPFGLVAHALNGIGVNLVPG